MMYNFYSYYFRNHAKGRKAFRKTFCNNDIHALMLRRTEYACVFFSFLIVSRGLGQNIDHMVNASFFIFKIIEPVSYISYGVVAHRIPSVDGTGIDVDYFVSFREVVPG